MNNGIVAGAALDVFDKEPVEPNDPLVMHENVICTPHLGAATSEAQENVAVDVAKQIVDLLVNGTIQNAINTASVSGEVLRTLEPHINLAEKIGLLHGQLATSAPEKIEIEFSGELNAHPTKPLTIACLNGILKPVLSDEIINAINAPAIARERGISISETNNQDSKNFTSFIKVSLKFKNYTKVIGGTIFGKNNPRITRIDDAYLELVPEGKIIAIQNEDKPGIVGKVGSLLGKNNINIAKLQLAMSPSAGKAQSFYSVEGEITPAIIKELEAIDGIVAVQEINL